MGRLFYTTDRDKTETIIRSVESTGEVIEETTIVEETRRRRHIEPDFIKVYTDAMIATKFKVRVSETESTLLYSLAKRMTYANDENPMTVGLNPIIKEAIASESGLSISHMDKVLSNLKKKGIIQSIGRGVIRLDPNIFAKGNYKEIEELQITWNANGVCASITFDEEENLTDNDA